MENWDRIKTVLYVVKTGSFSGAAKELRMTQSCVSRHVSMLEDALQERLFIRDSRRVRPTDAGLALVRAFRGPFERLELAWQDTLNRATGIQGSLSVGCLPEIGQSLFFAAWLEFQKRHPALNLEVQYLDSSAIVERVQNGTVQFGIVGYVPQKELIQSYALLAEETVLVAGKGARPDSMKADQPWPFVTYQVDDLLLRHFFQKFGAKLGISGYIEKVAVNSHRSMLDALFSSPYYAAVPRHRVQAELARGTLKQVGDVALKSEVFLIHAAGQEPGAREAEFKRFILREWKQRR